MAVLKASTSSRPLGKFGKHLHRKVCGLPNVKFQGLPAQFAAFDRLFLLVCLPTEYATSVVYVQQTCIMSLVEQSGGK